MPQLNTGSAENMNQKLNFNISLALYALEACDKMFPYGARNQVHNPMFVTKVIHKDSFLPVDEQTRKRYEMEHQKKILEEKNFFDAYREAQQLIPTHVKKLAGELTMLNCQEFAEYAAYVIKKKLGPASIRTLLSKYVSSLEILTLKRHVILLIGRDSHRNSMPENPNTWGSNAVVCDPWAKKCYPGSEFKIEQEKGAQTRRYDMNPNDRVVKNDLEGPVRHSKRVYP